MAYGSLLEAKTDMNQIFVNAKRFNAPGSPLFMDAKKLHVSLFLYQGVPYLACAARKLALAGIGSRFPARSTGPEKLESKLRVPDR